MVQKASFSFRLGQRTLHGFGSFVDSVEERILLKSICARDSRQLWCVPKTSLQMYMNVIFPSLKCSSLKAPAVSHEFIVEISKQSCKKDDNRKDCRTRIRT